MSNEWGITEGAKFYADHKAEWGPGRKTVMLAFSDGAELSDADIANKYNMKPQTVRPRRVELWRLGFIMPIGMKKVGRQRVQVWGATEQGKIQIEELRNR